MAFIFTSFSRDGTSRHRRVHASAGAYTLIELLAVMTLIAALVALAVPTTLRVQQSANLNSAGQTLNDMLYLARQEAVSKSHEVQVLFLKSTNINQWRAIQIRRMDETTTGPTPAPVSRITWLPEGVIIEEGARSPLLTADALITGTITLPNGKTMDYRGFRYRANGSTDNSITSANNYLTLRHAASGATAVNYYTVQVNPITGKPTTYRP